MIWEEIKANQQELDNAMATLEQRGIELAKAEQTYRIAKAKLELNLRKSGMPITLIPDLVKGDENVSELALKRDIAEVLWKSNLEAINVYKKKSDDLRMYFDKEYYGKEN